MPTYATPDPIDLAIDAQVALVEVTATERTDTVVSVTPSNPAKAVDVRGAQETKVDFDGRRLTIAGPRRITVFGPSESIDIRVEVPAASRLTVAVSVGGVRAIGRLGATRIKSSTGSVDLEHTGDLWLNAAHGNVTIGTADGSLDLTAAHGQVRIGTVSGDAVTKASHGSIRVGESAGIFEANLAYGDLEIDRALGSVTAKTAYGTVRLGEVSSGSIRIDSAYGALDVGVREGVAVWLDAASKGGRVRNSLDAERAPAASEATVDVRARTSYSDITIQRAR